jgi:hypothetical protein
MCDQKLFQFSKVKQATNILRKSFKIVFILLLVIIGFPPSVVQLVVEKVSRKFRTVIKSVFHKIYRVCQLSYVDIIKIIFHQIFIIMERLKIVDSQEFFIEYNQISQ